MCPAVDIPLDPFEFTPSFSAATVQTKAIRPGGQDSPGPVFFGIGSLGTRIITHDNSNFIMRTDEGSLEFYLNGRLVGVLDASSNFRILGTAKERRTTSQITLPVFLTPGGGVEFDPNGGPAWAFGLKHGSVTIAVGSLSYAGNLTLYRFSEDRLPLVAGDSPSFGSDYAIDVSGVTHLTQDRVQTLLRLDVNVFERSGTQVQFDSGWKLPQIASEQADTGLAWSNDNNILLDNGLAATTPADFVSFTKTMHALHYAFAAPTDLFVPTGLLVRISRSTPGGGDIIDWKIALVVGGSETGENKSDLVTLYPKSGADAWAEYGGEGDMWALPTLPTGAQLNASNFGMAFQASGGIAYVRLQNVQMRLRGYSFQPLHNSTMKIRSIRERAI